MTVQISKPAFNLREALTSLKRKIGLKGAEIIATETTDEFYSLVKPVMFRNKFINGGFDVWQRGTSFGASPTYTADRWSSQSNPTNSTVTQQAFTPGQTDVPGNPKYFYRVSIGSTETVAGDRVVIRQMVEDYTQFLGKWVVLSGWYRMTANIGGGNWLFQMKRSSSFYDNATEQTDPRGGLSPTATWKYFERRVYVSPSALSGQTMTSTASFGVMFYYQTAPAAGNIDFANLQLELDSATPFEYRPYATELALCQRYFYKLGGTNENYTSNGYVHQLAKSSAGDYFIHGVHPVQMRATPTMSTSLSAATYGGNNSGYGWLLRDWYILDRSAGTISITPEFYGRAWTLRLGTTANNEIATVLFWYGSSAAYIHFSAEL